VAAPRSQREPLFKPFLFTPAGGAGKISGVMVGRAFINRPWTWANVDSALYGSVDP